MLLWTHICTYLIKELTWSPLRCHLTKWSINLSTSEQWRYKNMLTPRKISTDLNGSRSTYLYWVSSAAREHLQAPPLCWQRCKMLSYQATSMCRGRVPPSETQNLYIILSDAFNSPKERHRAATHTGTTYLGMYTGARSWLIQQARPPLSSLDADSFTGTKYILTSLQ